MAFTDITHGSSKGCDGKRWGKPIAGNPGLIPGAGWNATEGWVSFNSLSVAGCSGDCVAAIC